MYFLYVCRFQRLVWTVGHCTKIRKIGRNRNTAVQPHSCRQPTVQSAVDEERRQTVSVHSRTGTGFHKPHDSRSQNRRKWNVVSEFENLISSEKNLTTCGGESRKVARYDVVIPKVVSNQSWLAGCFTKRVTPHSSFSSITCK